MATEGKTITCRAAVVYNFKSEIKIESIKVAPPPAEHVRLKMVACALCHSDLSFLDAYLPSQPLPYIPGHEGAGIVESVGEGVTTLKKGDKVLTLCLPRCSQCLTCVGGRSTYCLDYKRKSPHGGAFLRVVNLDGSLSYSLASTGDPINHCLGCSSFSEYVVIPENSAVKIHADAPLEKVCTVACGFPTGFGASSNAVDIKPGEKAGIWGLGGVGLACVLGCKDKKAGKIIGIDVNHDKEPMARKMGCTDYIAISDLEKGTLPTKIQQMTLLGLDFAFVCIGNTGAMEEAFNSLGPGGTLVVVGVPKSTDTVTFPALALLANKKIIGTIIGDYNIHRGIPELVERYLKGELPVDDFSTKTIKLENINDAFNDMRRGQGVRTVVIF